MTQTEQQRAAKEFAAFWKDKGDEKQETQRYWIGLLTELFSPPFSRQSGNGSLRFCKRHDGKRDCSRIV